MSLRITLLVLVQAATAAADVASSRVPRETCLGGMYMSHKQHHHRLPPALFFSVFLRRCSYFLYMMAFFRALGCDPLTAAVYNAP